MAKRRTPPRTASGRFRKSRKSTSARRKTTRRKTATTRRKTARKNPSTSAKRKAAARKAAATRRANARRRSAAARKAAATRKRTARRPSGSARTYARRRRSARRNPAPARRRRTVRRNPSRRLSKQSSRRGRDASGRFTKAKGVATLARARRYIKSPPSAPAEGFRKMFKMRSNPSGIFDVLLAAVPVALSFNAGRYITNRVTPMIPGAAQLGQYAAPVGAGVLLLGSHFATKRIKALRALGNPIVLGFALHAVDSGVQSFAPKSVRKALGLRAAPTALPAPDEEEQEAQNEYLAVQEYLRVNGRRPIDTNLALSEYVGVDGYEADLGGGVGMEADLGYAADLGSFDDRNLGGTSRGSYGRRRIPQLPMRAGIPARSYTRQIPQFSESDNSPGSMYRGIFGKGSSIGG